ncbi:MAG: molybdopterin/thiamine biosynthesis adenylyltransferase [Bacteriovoracaceae bacterium]|jgi:molybdopterin/thiamine biosynthesis adenylyltransferase
MENTKFDYNKAFSRNLGWLSREEQKIISEKVIAIPGMGGVGGYHLHSLIRLGFKRFKIADFDEFDVHNFNRQIGAKVSTVGLNKADVMKNIVLDIIPDAEVDVYEDGVNEENMEEFLKGVDILVDGLDVYVIKLRIKLFDLALKKGIFVTTAAPLGMGTSIISFHPDKMNFNEYFNMNCDMETEDLLPHFLAGVAPSLIHTKYLYHKNEIDFKTGRVPSLHCGVISATAAICSEVVKIVLQRGKLKYAPHSHHYDFYLHRSKHIWRPFGNRNILQKIIISIIKKKFQEMSS